MYEKKARNREGCFFNKKFGKEKEFGRNRDRLTDRQYEGGREETEIQTERVD